MRWIGGLALVLWSCGCAQGGEPATDPDPSGPERILRADVAWYGDNRSRLEEMIAENGRSSDGYDPTHPPVAVFDWDNTMIKNDIGDAYFAWLLNNDKVLRPADWGEVSPWLTAEARQSIEAACGEGEAGHPLPTSTDLDCADELFSVYEGSRDVAGNAAFQTEGYNHRWFVPRYAWLVQLQAGYTPDELEEFATQAVAGALAAEIGAEQTVGTRHTVHAWIRIYDQSSDLMRALIDHGFDVWVVSASPQPAVRAFAEHVAVADDHVVGIRSQLDAEGRVIHDLQGCGPVGPEDNAVVTFAEGKRCWINKVVFGDASERAIQQRPAEQGRPFFVAGDADTDVSMFVDAVGMRLVINRNKPEVMCRAYHDADGNWLVNPMFIDALPRAAAPYPCSSTACFGSRGEPLPCLDATGAPIPDQVDEVFAEPAEEATASTD